MFTLLSSILGFLSAGLPNVLNFFQDKNDKAHELEMMRLQTEREVQLAKENAASAQKIEEIKLSEVETKGFFDEKQALYTHDAEIGKGASQKIIDLRASVRPVISYGMFLMFCFVEGYGCYYAWLHNVDFNTLMSKVWDEDSRALLSAVISFHFGSRAFEKRK